MFFKKNFLKLKFSKFLFKEKYFDMAKYRFLNLTNLDDRVTPAIISGTPNIDFIYIEAFNSGAKVTVNNNSPLIFNSGENLDIRPGSGNDNIYVLNNLQNNFITIGGDGGLDNVNVSGSNRYDVYTADDNSHLGIVVSGGKGIHFLTPSISSRVAFAQLKGTPNSGDIFVIHQTTPRTFFNINPDNGVDKLYVKGSSSNDVYVSADTSLGAIVRSGSQDIQFQTASMSNRIGELEISGTTGEDLFQVHQNLPKTFLRVDPVVGNTDKLLVKGSGNFDVYVAPDFSHGAIIRPSSQDIHFLTPSNQTSIGKLELIGSNSNDTYTIHQKLPRTFTRVIPNLGQDKLIVKGSSNYTIYSAGDKSHGSVVRDGSLDTHFITTNLSDRVATVELLGTSGNDKMTVHSSPGSTSYIFHGFDGDDYLIGGPGDDTLNGGSGADILDGGTGFNNINSGASDNKRVLYLNFDGAGISKNDLLTWSNQNKDWQVNNLDPDDNGIIVPSFLQDNNNRENIIQKIMMNIYNDFKFFDVDIVRHKGLAVAGLGATTLFFGNTDFNIPGLRGIASSVDTQNDNITDIGFVSFTFNGSEDEIARFASNTGAHEAGHTYGLSHVDRNGYNELMRIGAQATNIGNAKYDYNFLDKDFSRNDPNSTGVQNSYRSLKFNLQSIGNPPPGDTGTSNIPNDLNDKSCCCPFCFGIKEYDIKNYYDTFYIDLNHNSNSNSEIFKNYDERTFPLQKVNNISSSEIINEHSISNMRKNTTNILLYSVSVNTMMGWDGMEEI